MPNRLLTIKVPGKMMIAGEFAVLEPHQKLVVMAVDRFIYATIEQSDENRLTLESFDLFNLKWNYNNNKINIRSDDERISFVKDAMEIVLLYLHELGITPSKFTLTIKSELNDESGIKYGLGSSAAVVTSVIAAILKKNLPQNPPSKLIFKLAAISHVKTQGNGSGADVAASSFGGLLQYSSFQADWLKSEMKNANSITELLKIEWTYFSVKPIQLPEDVYVCVGWTGKPASTVKLVDKILHLKKDNPALFEQFLLNSEQAVGSLLKGMEEADVSSLLKGVQQNRHALATVGRNANVVIETPLLSELCDLAERFGGAGKPSGAGGGDCGIAFMPSKKAAEDLMRAWNQVGIKPLNIKAYPLGAATVSDLNKE